MNRGEVLPQRKALQCALASQPQGPLEQNLLLIGLMVRAMWNGSISFGLVQIPVELYPGDEQRELSFTMHLIEGMSGAWTPTKYKDTYRDDLLKIIEDKVSAGPAHVVSDEQAPSAPSHPACEGVIDLVALLRRSINAKQGNGGHGQRAGARSRAEKRPRRERSAWLRARPSRRTA